MTFKKYMHVERLGTDEVQGLLDGDVIVQPKVDGANVSVWLEADGLHCATRNQEVTRDANHALTQWVQANTDILLGVFSTYPNWRLYGEHLIPHSLKTYRVEAWRKVYFFDVLDDLTDQFVPYDLYQPVLAQFGLDYIPIMAVVTNPTIDAIQGLLERNTYLIEDGKGLGEGVVVKRYGYQNCYGRTVWGKLVRNEFKEKNTLAFGPVKVSGGLTAEIILAQQYVTRNRVEKAKSELEPWQTKKIPGLFGIVYHDIVTEELWDFIKDHKNKVTIDFNDLYGKVVQQVKAIYPELF